MSNLPDGMTDDAIPGFNDPEPQAEAAAPHCASVDGWRYTNLTVEVDQYSIRTIPLSIARRLVAEAYDAGIEAERERHAEDARIAAIFKGAPLPRSAAGWDCCPQPNEAEVAMGKALHKFIQTYGWSCPSDHQGPWRHHYENMAHEALAAIIALVEARAEKPR